MYQIDNSSTMDGALNIQSQDRIYFQVFCHPILNSDYCPGKKNSMQEKSLHGGGFNLWLPSTNLILLDKLEKKR